MTEEHHNDDTKQPYLGRLGATVIATLCGGILLVFVSAAFNAPQRADEKSARLDAAQELEIVALRSEIAALREAYNEHRANSGADLKELRSLVEAGSQNRFTEIDWERENARLLEREQANRRDIARIDGQLDGIISYLTEEQREDRRNRN